MVDEIAKLRPFGMDNPEPLFVAYEVPIRDKTVMGLNGQHVKVRLHNFWALAFNKADTFKDLKIGDKIDVVFTVEWNNFNGRKDVQLRLVDWKI